MRSDVEMPQEDKILEWVCLDPGESACGRAAEKKKKLLLAGYSLRTSSLPPFQKAHTPLVILKSARGGRLEALVPTPTRWWQCLCAMVLEL